MGGKKKLLRKTNEITRKKGESKKTEELRNRLEHSKRKRLKYLEKEKHLESQIKDANYKHAEEQQKQKEIFESMIEKKNQLQKQLEKITINNKQELKKFLEYAEQEKQKH